MRKIRRYIIKNWFWIVLGLVLTRKAMEYCYRQRGSFQVGGEFFILPVILMAVSFTIRGTKAQILSVKEFMIKNNIQFGKVEK